MASPPLVDTKTFVTHPDYLGISDFWPASLLELEEATAPGIQGVIWELGLGGGKSFECAVLLLLLLYRMAYSEVCRGENPRSALGLDPNSMLCVANVAVKAKTAKDVVFGRALGLIERSPWFREFLPHDKGKKSEIRFLKHNYSIFPGNSKITSVAGFDVFAAVFDEANLLADTSSAGGEDHAATMFAELQNRVLTRFGKRGYVAMISSRKSIRDFTARKRAALLESEVEAATWHLPPPQTSWAWWPPSKCSAEQWRRFDPQTLLWLSRPSPYRPSMSGGELWIPERFWGPFESDPENALRDLASIPSESEEPFIKRLATIRPAFEMESPLFPHVRPEDWMTQPFETLLRSDFRGHPSQVYHFHVDLSLGKRGGDATGVALAFESGIDEAKFEKTGERIPLIDVPLALLIRAPKGGEIQFSKIRDFLHWLRTERGFRFGLSSFDGWQSVDSQQLLRRSGFRVEPLSLDISLKGYNTLKTALYEGRLFFPPAHGQTPQSSAEWLEEAASKGEPWAAFQTEMRQLQRVVRGQRDKVDHPSGGTKDVADAVAGAVAQVIKRASGVKDLIR